MQLKPHLMIKKVISEKKKQMSYSHNLKNIFFTMLSINTFKMDIILKTKWIKTP